MQTLILIAHSTPSLSSPPRDEANSLHSFLSVSFPLSYSFTLTLFLFSRPSTIPASHGGFIPTPNSFFLLVLDLTVTRTILGHFHPSRLCTNIALSSLCT